MIRNEREYRITKKALREFEQVVTEYPEHPPEGAQVHPLIWQTGREAYRSQLEDLKTQVAEYEALRSGLRQVFSLTSIEELPAALISSRIAQGLTQKQLAERLGLKEPQVQRYEATAYASASLTRLLEVVRALGLRVTANVLLPAAEQAGVLCQETEAEAPLDRRKAS